MVEETAEALRRYIDDGQFEVPPISEVAARITELTSNPDVSAAAIVELVQHDPGLASALLRYANSAALGARVEIVSVHQAVVHLGIECVSQVALAASLRSGVFDAPAYAVLTKVHWVRSISAALVAKRIARLLAQNVEVAFLCGLLWPIGAMLVLRALGEMPTRPGLLAENEADILSIEMNARFREAAIESWSLPKVVSDALGPSASASEKTAEAHIASLAYEIAPQLLVEGPHDIGALTALPAAESLNLYPDHFEQLLSQGKELGIEIEAMR